MVVRSVESVEYIVKTMFNSFQILTVSLTQLERQKLNTLVLTVVSELDAGWQSQLGSVC